MTTFYLANFGLSLAVGTICAFVSLLMVKKLPTSPNIVRYNWTSLVIGIFATYPYMMNLVLGNIKLHLAMFFLILFMSVFMVTLTINSITIKAISIVKLILISVIFGSSLYFSIFFQDFLLVKNLETINVALISSGLILTIGTSIAMIKFLRYLRELGQVQLGTLLFASLAIGVAFSSLYFTIESTFVSQTTSTLFVMDRFYIDLNSLPWTLSILSLVLVYLAPVILEELKDKKQRAQEEEGKKQIEFLSHYDSLTTLPNRQLFLCKLEELIQDNKPLGLLFFDLDRFKTINDVLGHATGDKLLLKVTERLIEFSGKDNFISRIGGDEFAILATNHTVVEVEKYVIGAMASLKAPFYIDDHRLYITATVGGTFFNREETTTEELMKQADAAVTRAKERGKNNYEFFSERRYADRLERLELENDLRKALVEGQFELYYQPQVTVKTKTVESFEALIRWKHPQKGFISPSIFIPIAEELLLINDIGKWVLRESCRQLKHWHMMGNPELKISVNVSLVQFYEKDFITDLQYYLTESSLNPHYLNIEITETMVMKDLQQTVLITKQLQELGVKISLDDFGKGYSSLSHIRDIPLDCLKIDGSFVRDILHSKEAAVIIETITLMAHSLDLVVVAEQVEEKEQVRFLEALQCNIIQGYYYGKPMPPEEAISYLDKSLLV